MRTKSLSTLVFTVLLVAACGGGGAPATSPRPAATSASTPVPAASGEAAAGTIDCARIKATGTQLLSLQLLAQIRDPASAERIKTRQIGSLDLDAFLSAMHDLHALDGVSSPLGDAKAAIDRYEDAAKAAQTLFATEPITQAAVDAYVKHVGPVGEFLGLQTAIAGAMDVAGC